MECNINSYLNLLIVQETSAINGSYDLGDSENVDMSPYLLFGFEPNGTLSQDIKYSKTDSEIVILLWSNKVIDSFMNTKFDVSTFFKMMIGENIANNSKIVNNYNQCK